MGVSHFHACATTKSGVSPGRDGEDRENRLWRPTRSRISTGTPKIPILCSPTGFPKTRMRRCHTCGNAATPSVSHINACGKTGEAIFLCPFAIAQRLIAPAYRGGAHWRCVYARHRHTPFPKPHGFHLSHRTIASLSISWAAFPNVHGIWVIDLSTPPCRVRGGGLAQWPRPEVGARGRKGNDGNSPTPGAPGGGRQRAVERERPQPSGRGLFASAGLTSCGDWP